MLALCFTVPEHSWTSEGEQSLNQKDAIPQCVFKKSVAPHRENPTVLLHVGYSSCNVITLCYRSDEWGRQQDMTEY
jgi:hypothetical protein